MYQRCRLAVIILMRLAACAIIIVPVLSAMAVSSAVESQPPWQQDPYPATYHPLPSVTTAITHATILDGAGGRIEQGTIVFEDGRIAAVGKDVAIPSSARVIDGTGKWLTPGIIDMHSHLGVSSRLHQSLSDGNERSGPVQAELWIEHALWPQHPTFVRALAGGVTTLQVLPGSANLIGGRSVIIRNVPARTVQEMKFPGAPYGLKMACGENPTRVYGGKDKSPGTRMANVAGYREAFIQAREYMREWETYLENAAQGKNTDKNGEDKESKPPKRNLAMDTLAAVLDGEIFVNIHCYRADEMAVMIDLAEEMGFEIAAFHHAIEAYKIADILARQGVCAVMWPDWWGYKLEAFDAVPENIALVDREGCAIAHSDSEAVVQSMHLEVAKAMAAGNRIGLDISRADAMRWITINPARAMGIDDKVGSLEAGKQADVVVWSADPFSVYTLAEQVYIDGALVFERGNPARTPQGDFELGITGRGDY